MKNGLNEFINMCYSKIKTRDYVMCGLDSNKSYKLDKYFHTFFKSNQNLLGKKGYFRELIFL